MEVGVVGQTQNLIRSEAKAEQAEETYEIKLMKMAQESEKVTGGLIEDTVEFSKEAMDKFMAEVNGKRC